MTYRIRGLSAEPFQELFACTDRELSARRAVRVRADSDRGFPCRVTLEDARVGETLVLCHHTSHDVDTPYRSAYAIYVRETAGEAAEFVDSVPPVFDGRPIALRGFAASGMLQAAALAMPGDADAAIRTLLADGAVAYIDAHNAAHGCFSARIERHGEQDR
jgi:Protein of unknown function (DUF1203)